jgi:plasmid stabilization system protein ParE
MSLPVILRPEAEAEIEDACDWYESQREGLGSEFLRVLDAAFAVIARQPELYAILYRQARRAPLRRFPYSIIYVAQRDHIDVVACFHASRAPRRWQQRL